MVFLPPQTQGYSTGKTPSTFEALPFLMPGQYRGAYKVGHHRGYNALQQKAPMRFWRDQDRDAQLDMSNSSIEESIIGANIHRANAYRPSLQVGKWSAGCQVVQDPHHFAFLMTICKQASTQFGNNFTYHTLRRKRDIWVILQIHKKNRSPV